METENLALNNKFGEFILNKRSNCDETEDSKDLDLKFKIE